MAEAVGFGVSTVAMWESGKRTPSFKRLNGAQIKQIGTWEIQNKLIDILRQYLQLDAYGKMNVQALLNREFGRCQEQGPAKRVDGLKIGIQYDIIPPSGE